ncbi:transmembrane serine/threonine-kinase H PknH domain protein [Mycobacterium kansasii 662]|uniref:Transmembrane serine/threonine-kinase H PknH domain protein n=2 Tax=Mycobacterium kansasii TaxID=1768 RepID=X7XY56_MYCKA|nr:transmembrane serine/threonine-kinase H PknH domain protein [Mycobacterium kansasii 662]
MYNCGQNTNQGGPSRAIYGLFPTLDALKKAFNDDIAAVDLMNCPGEGRRRTAGITTGRRT